MLVMIALLMGTALAVSFLSQQTTSTAVAQNVTAHSHARAIAESALVAAIEHVRSTDTWRDDLTHGSWETDIAFQGGTYSLWGEDGWDEDGDGTISGAETDSDLADDDEDLVTLTVVATYDGVTHRVQTIITSISAMPCWRRALAFEARGALCSIIVP